MRPSWSLFVIVVTGICRRVSIPHKQLCAGLVLVLSASNVSALSTKIGIDQLEYGEWTASGIVLELALTGINEGQAQVFIDRISHPKLIQLRNIQLHCPQWRQSDSSILCSRFVGSGQDAQGIQFDILATAKIDLQTTSIELDALQVTVAGQHFEGRVTARKDSLAIAGDVQLDASKLGAHVARLDSRGFLSTSMSGKVRTHLDLLVKNGALVLLEADLRATELTLASNDGLHGGEKISGRVDVALVNEGPFTRYDVATQLDSGFLYAELGSHSVTYDAALNPMQLKSVGSCGATFVCKASILSVELRNLMQAEGTLAADLKERRVANADLEWSIESLSGLFNSNGFYQSYFDPQVLKLQLDGVARGSVRVASPRAGVQLALSLRQVSLKNTQGQFEFTGINADMYWSDIIKNTPSQSHVSWSGAQFYKIEAGAGAAQFQLQGRSMAFDHIEVPVAGGSISLNDGRVEGIGTDDLKVKLSGTLSNLRLSPLSKAFDWKPLRGSVSGVWSDIRYQNHVIQTQGKVLVNLFDGQVAANNVRIEEPLGVAPRFYGDFDFQHLDLSAVTQTFSFGEISGSLTGYIHDLELVNWRPNRFDARFYTPQEDDRTHVISARAVDNLSSIGGLSGALGRTYLRFFESFRYDQIGLGCRLQQGVCEMSGIAPTASGYYIVRGKWLPRIDVVGDRLKVDWRRLIDNIKAAVASDGPALSPK